MDCAWGCQRVILGWFYSYGYFLARHPFCFMIIPLVVCGVLAVGFKFYDPRIDTEYLYAPSQSRAIDDREVVRMTFPDNTDENYTPFGHSDIIKESQVIFKSIDSQAVLTEQPLKEIYDFYRLLISTRITDNGWNFTYNDVCKKQNGNCVTGGAFVFKPDFSSKLQNKNVTYPFWKGSPGVDLSLFIGNVDLMNGRVLVSANSLKLTFPLKTDERSRAWESAFAKLLREAKFATVNFAYTTSYAMSEELDKGAKGDIVFFSLTFTFMITYASIASSGGDCISSRALLANAGVIAVVFGIFGAFGLVTLFGVNFVSIVGTMPFLSLGIGVDDMFLLMTSWSETLSITDLTIPERIGLVYKKAGIGITITSLTNCLAFAIGAFSIFRSVQNFCIYTGVAVILCYFCNACVFGACLTLHGRRVYARRHVFTCQKVNKSRSELKQAGAPCYKIWLCGGAIPTSPDDDQNLFERGPRKVLAKILLWNPLRYFILIFFAGYLAVSIWGCTKLRQGLELKNLAPKASYFNKFQTWNEEDFGSKLPISFVTTTTKDYTNNQTLQDVQDLLTAAQLHPLIMENFSVCWFTSLAKTPLYNSADDDAFFAGLINFLRRQPQFYNDIVFGENNRSITASRCYAYSYKITDSTEQANIMTEMRKLADSSPADVFAYHPSFVFFEQYVVIMSSTLQTVGITIAVMFVATCIFLPHPLMVVLVIAQVFMIITGIFGFMAFWDLTLSSITMIELIMSVGFSVDFCAHVCTAYMVSEKKTRQERSKDAVVHASSPILNGGLSSLIGVFMLYFSESYIFQSFFKIMLLVIGFGVIHAVFLIPVILSFIGPSAHVKLEEDSSPQKLSATKISNNHSDNAEEVVSAKSLPDINLQLRKQGGIVSSMGELRDDPSQNIAVV